MKTRVSLRALSVGLAVSVGMSAAAFGQSSTEPYFTDAIIFGDSLSDPGNLPALTGDPNNPPSPPYFGNRFSNGPVFSELFPELLGFEATRQLNFAVGGAQAGMTNIEPALFGTGVEAQINGYLSANPTPRETDLFQIYVGANDYFEQLATLPFVDPADVPSLVQAEVNETVAQIGANAQALVAAGAHQMLLPNLPNLGATPLFNSVGQAELGFNYTVLHNTGIAGIAQGLNDSGTIAYVVDVDEIFTDILTNPSKYGVSNVTTPCLTTMGVCTDPETRVFFDDVHPTAQVHALFAAATADTLIAPRTIAPQAEASLASARAFHNRLRGPIALAGAQANGARLFADVAYSEFDRDNQSYAVGHSSEEIAVSIGVVGRFDGQLTVGAVGQVLSGETDLNGELGGFDRTGLRGAVFARGDAGPFDLSGAVSIGVDQLNDIERDTGVAGQISTGETDAGVFAAELEVGLPLALSETASITPFARALVDSVSINQYDESGAVGLSQRVFDVGVSRFDLEVGARGMLRLDRLTFAGDAAYVTSLEDPEGDISTALLSEAAVRRTLPFTEFETDYIRLGGDVSLDLTDDVRISLGAIGYTGRDDGDEFTGFIRLSRALGQ